MYTLEHPLTGEIRYVGKTQTTMNRRYSVHISRKNNTHLNCWIKSLKSQGLKPLMIEIETVDFSVWRIMEPYWISQFRTWGFDLTNIHPGGYGPDSGYKMSAESSEKKSLKLTGHNVSKETRSKISLGNKDKKRTEKQKIEQRLLWAKLAGKQVDQMSLTGDFIKAHISIEEAARSINGDAATISKVCKGVGRNKTHKGFKWKYK